MAAQKLNLIIVDENPEELKQLDEYLYNRFTSCIAVCTLAKKENVSQYVKPNTNIIVIKSDANNFDMYLMNSARTLSQEAEVLKLSCRNDIGMAVELLYNTLYSPEGRNKAILKIAQTLQQIRALWL